ncbi:MAG: UDP-N-acetylglucosamine diphosphorylase/glucosamine-1-phosphate N-acetyltransferase [Cognaticolwellia sp.]|jgi:UDP-N-acetylglucosamine diphosphorylase/glucosamine-1-phosphate N-acetyltransferase
MNIILFDSAVRTNLLPLTYTRPIADLRIGILKLYEKWEKRFPNATISYKTVDYLSNKFPVNLTDENLWIDGSIVTNDILSSEIQALEANEVLTFNGENIAYYSASAVNDFSDFQAIETKANPIKLNHSWDIFSNNERAIEEDFALVTKGRTSQPISDTNRIIGDRSRLFVEKGVEMECATLNVKTGVIYIGKDSVILEGCFIRGALALNEGSMLKMGSKIYGPTTLGKYAKVGGEVNNAVIYDYSNKGHEGYLGNAVLGEWCNLGADTNNSNLKNNYQSVKLWDYNTERFTKTGLQFCGLIMGDHSKSGINTMFNTGTVVGVAANIFGANYPRNFLPSFTWGGTGNNKTFRMKQVIEMAEAMMNRKNIPLTENDLAILEYIFEASAKYRNWEK